MNKRILCWILILSVLSVSVLGQGITKEVMEELDFSFPEIDLYILIGSFILFMASYINYKEKTDQNI